jgi:hypothetical protein
MIAITINQTHTHYASVVVLLVCHRPDVIAAIYLYVTARSLATDAKR